MSASWTKRMSSHTPLNAAGLRALWWWAQNNPMINWETPSAQTASCELPASNQCGPITNSSSIIICLPQESENIWLYQGFYQKEYILCCLPPWSLSYLYIFHISFHIRKIQQFNSSGADNRIIVQMLIQAWQLVELFFCYFMKKTNFWRPNCRWRPSWKIEK